MAVPWLSFARGEVTPPHALIGQVPARDVAEYACLRASPLQLGLAFSLLLIAYCGDLSRLRELKTVVLLYEQIGLVECRRAGRREGIFRLDQPYELPVRCGEQRVLRLAARSQHK